MQSFHTKYNMLPVYVFLFIISAYFITNRILDYYDKEISIYQGYNPGSVILRADNDIKQTKYPTYKADNKQSKALMPVGLPSGNPLPSYRGAMRSSGLTSAVVTASAPLFTNDFSRSGIESGGEMMNASFGNMISPVAKRGNAGAVLHSATFLSMQRMTGNLSLLASNQPQLKMGSDELFASAFDTEQSVYRVPGTPDSTEGFETPVPDGLWFLMFMAMLFGIYKKFF